jgi:ketosteroid isomerase-like protein
MGDRWGAAFVRIGWQASFGLGGSFAPDWVAGITGIRILTFDILPPLHYQGINAYRKNFEAWFAAVQGPIEYETRDLRITTGEDVAFCHSLNRVKSTRVTGETSETWVRVTVGFRKMEGTWRITHEHVSVPCDMEMSHALLELQP